MKNARNRSFKSYSLRTTVHTAVFLLLWCVVVSLVDSSSALSFKTKTVGRTFKNKKKRTSDFSDFFTQPSANEKCCSFRDHFPSRTKKRLMFWRRTNEERFGAKKERERDHSARFFSHLVHKAQPTARGVWCSA